MYWKHSSFVVNFSGYDDERDVPIVRPIFNVRESAATECGWELESMAGGGGCAIE